jgi:hypothetical protein
MLTKIKNKLASYTLEKRKTGILNETMDMVRQINTIIQDKFAMLDDITSRTVLLDFLQTCNENTVTVEHPDFLETIDHLRNIKKQYKEIYLCFVGIPGNEDAIDNNGRSRQDEVRKGLIKDYYLSQREWYIEVRQNGGRHTITSPVRDSSGSYVISILKDVQGPSNDYIGVIGFDLGIKHLVQNIKTDNRIILASEKGEIVFDSGYSIRRPLESRYNLRLLFDRNIVRDIYAGASNCKLTSLDSHPCLVSYCPVHDGKYYLVQVAKD